MKPKILAVIPARGGSKGVPRKNIRISAGKPLIAWTIEEAKKSKYIERIILSSEDDEIIEVAKKYGCEVPFKRPIEFAQDDTPGIDPVLHAIEQCSGYDYIILLQPTSPLRTVEDIDRSIEKVLKENLAFCVSVTEQEKHPNWMYTLSQNKLIPVLSNGEEISSRRQDLPKVYGLNGAIYIAKIEKLLEKKSFLNDDTGYYIMEKKNSLDIDSEEDLLYFEFLIGNVVMRKDTK